MEIIIGFIISGLIGALIGKYKGCPGPGFLWGLFLGPIGWLIVALGSDDRPKCPSCGGAIEEGFSTCKHCGSSLAVSLKRVMTFPEQRKFVGPKIDCPYCGAPLPLANIKSGMNRCTECQQEFKAAE